MKTVAELAKDCGVSSQTIYRRLNKVKQGETRCLTQEHNGITYITEDGIELIKICLTPVKQIETEVEQCKTDVKQEDTAEVLFLRSQIIDLQAEINKEREHSRTLALEVAKLANQSQVLQLASGEKKQGIIKRLFSRKDGTNE